MTHQIVDPLQEDSNRDSAPMPLPKKDVSDRQREASIANGSRSRGPKTQEGKDASSKNSLKHGIYQKQPAPITTGPFAEDPNDINEFIDQIVTSLRPRNAIETFMAHKISHEFLRGVRLEKVEGSLLSRVTSLRPNHWTELTDDLSVSQGLAEYLANPDRERLGLWEWPLTDFIVKYTPSESLRTSQTDRLGRLKEALARLGDTDAAKAWVAQKVSRLECDLTCQDPWDTGEAAEKMVAELAKLGTIGTASTRNLNRLLAEYRKLQQMPAE
jgi:hypothetical protein